MTARTNGTDGMVTPENQTRTDAAVELDRIARGAKKDLEFNSTPSSEC